MQLLIVGGRGGTNVGDSFFRAAGKFELDPLLLDIKGAFDAPRFIRYIYWYLLGRRPPCIGSFSRQVARRCREHKPKWLLVTGMAPVDKDALIKIGELGISRINYLTDDPWNRSHFSRWFLEALPYYDIIYSTRRANISDLLGCGCKKVEYLPFGYDGELFYPEALAEEERLRYYSDLIFVGGADKDRIAYIDALVKSGFKVALYGSYWQRYRETRGHTLGQADLHKVRKATRAAKIALCLVRKANRDGHSMRSLEIPAIGTCLLAEDTEEHRQIFGKEGEAVVFFRSCEDMIDKARWLLQHEDERRRLAEAGHRLITSGSNTYAERLHTILGV